MTHRWLIKFAPFRTSWGEIVVRGSFSLRGVLKPIDHAVLPSDGKSIRWRNAAQWARNTMVNEDGRMKKTKNGIWEISGKGRKWLHSHDAD